MTGQVIKESIDIEALAEDLQALANPNRLALIRLLERPRYGEEIAQSLDMTRQSALKHIQRLEDRGFVRALHGRRKTGPVIEYQTVPARLFAVTMGIQEISKVKPSGGPQIRREEKTMSGLSQEEPLTEQVGAAKNGDAAPFAKKPVDSSSTVQLLFVTGPWAGRKIKLEGDRERWTLGRGDDRDIKIDHDPYVSNEHCEIQTGRNGFDVVDTYSANGTRLNYTNIPKGNRAPLRQGDVVTLGHTSVVFQVV